MPKNKKKRHQEKVSELERLYSELIKIASSHPSLQRDSLQQPSVLRVIDSVTTYGAFEEPI